MTDDLVALAGVAAAGVTLHCSREARPLEVLLNESLGPRHMLEYITRPIISEVCVRTITGLGYNTTRGLDLSYMEMYDGGHLWPLYGRY